MDYLDEAKLQIELSEGSPRADWKRDHLISAVAHALIALCERLDAVTGTPDNAQGKAIRVLHKDA